MKHASRRPLAWLIFDVSQKKKYMTSIPAEKPTLPPYLQNNDWEEELNFKLWVTKGARFCADKRLLRLHTLSSLATSFLSAYLIIVSLLPLYVPSVSAKMPSNALPLLTTGISILLLVYTLIESSKDYKLRAHFFHQCALKVSRLYNELRRLKEEEDKGRKKEALRSISERYDEVLELYENHEPIDYDIFQTQKPEYFHLSRPHVWWRHVRYYAVVQFRYHLVIVLPPALIAYIAWY